MDTEMIERVSKAILETPNAYDYRSLVAINAIKAMREPTNKMLNAGRLGQGSLEKYQRMIDTIIGDK